MTESNAVNYANVKTLSEYQVNLVDMWKNVENEFKNEYLSGSRITIWN